MPCPPQHGGKKTMLKYYVKEMAVSIPPGQRLGLARAVGRAKGACHLKAT